MSNLPRAPEEHACESTACAVSVAWTMWHMWGLIQLSFRNFLLAIGEEQKPHRPIVPHPLSCKNPESDFGIVLLMSLDHPDQGCNAIIELS